MKHIALQSIEQHAVTFIDPRVRLMAAILLLALVVSSGTGGFPWAVAAVCLPASVLCGMRAGTLVLRLLHPLFIALVILLLKSFMGTAQQQVLLQTATFDLLYRPEGFSEGLYIVSRIIGAVSVAVLFSQIMTFTETMAAMAWLRVPRGLVDVSLFAWRSLFLFYDGAQTVYTAQKNRLGYCGIRRSIKSFGNMAGMLTIKAFDNSQTMTTAMTQRGYDGTLPLLSATRPSWLQLSGFCLFAVAATVLWIIQK